ncbi:MAG: hypothetical protein ABH859_05855 [Pseudomonadota bacterium]
MKIKNITWIMLLLIFAACSKNSANPEFVTETTDTPTSAINERLAEQTGLKHFIYHVGPVDLPAHTNLTDALENPLVMSFHVDQPLWIIGFKPKVIDASGEELPSDLLFHAIVSNEHEENPLCETDAVANPFVVANSTLTEIAFPKGYGYAVLSTDSLIAEVVLYNTSNISYIDVSFELDVVAKEMNEYAGLKDVKPLLLDVDPCTHQPLQIQPEEFTERQISFPVPAPGNLLIGQGIMQRFASFIELFKNSDPTSFWRAEAYLDENHYIEELIGNPFEDPAGVEFKEDDELTLKVGYENTSGNWYKGASAAAMVYFAIDN